MKKNSHKNNFHEGSPSLSQVLLSAAVILISFLIPLLAYSADVTLAWDANSEPDLDGYKLYYGTSSRNYTVNVDVGNTTQYTLTGLTEGTTYYFAATAYDFQDNESNYSAEVVYTTSVPNNPPATPAKPTGPTGGYTQTNYNFSTSATDPDGDDLVYKYDWGDGSNSGWGAATRGHSWSSPGSYCVKARAKDEDDAVSEWSACRTITITKEPVSDSDGDGVPDDEDDFPFDPDEWLDTDGDGIGNNADEDDDDDGMPDDWENQYGLNPLKDDAEEDPDGDGVSNIDEYNAGTDPTVDDYNSVPERPVILTPENYDTVSMTPRFQAAEFYDADGGDRHKKSQWQVFDELSDTRVFDVKSPSALTTLKVPKLILNENSGYYVKVRYFDNHGGASEWSQPVTFMTDINADDADGNGIPDHQEVEGRTDMDGDGKGDRRQDDIKCLNSEGQTSYVGVSIKHSPNVLAIDSVRSEDPGDLLARSDGSDKPESMPFSLIHFKVLLDVPGDETEVTVYLSEEAPQDSKLYKYDPIEDNWQDYSEYAEFGPSRKSFTLTLKDGGFGDTDGTENGVIVDPTGIGAAALSTASVDDEDEFDNDLEEFLDGLDISCFISTAAHQSGNPQPSALWREIRGRELAILFIMTLLFFAGKIVALKIRQNRRFVKID